MKTEAGTELTKHEASCVKSLKRLARKWDNAPNRLWLFSASGTLHVMMKEDADTNPVPEFLSNAGYKTGSVNPENCICTIDIPNDGGDW